MSEPGPGCLNCNETLAGDFCQNCGQKAQPLQLSMLTFILGWIRETFETDGRLARTIKPMFIRPGFLPREYLAGRRVRYTSPLKLFVFSTVIGFLVLGSFSQSGLEIVIDAPDGTRYDNWLVNWFADRMELLSRLGPEEMLQRIESSFFETAPTMLALMIPLVALQLKLFFWRRQYVEHMVFVLHQHAVVVLLLVPPALSRHTPFILLGILLSAAHLLFALKTFYGRRWFGTIATWVGAMFFYGVLALMAFLVAILWAIAKT